MADADCRSCLARMHHREVIYITTTITSTVLSVVAILVMYGSGVV